MKYLLEKQETDRILFREINQADFECWLDFFKSPDSFAHWKHEPEEPQVACENWYKKQLNRYAMDLGGMNALIERASGKLIGHCGLLIQTVDDALEMEIGYSLLPDHRNKGFATEAAIKCRDFAFQSNFSESLISIVSVTNTPSANVAIKNGMEFERQTVYNQNHVNIFRINRQKWQQQLS